jgi:hypothetical protein
MQMLQSPSCPARARPVNTHGLISCSIRPKPELDTLLHILIIIIIIIIIISSSSSSSSSNSSNSSSSSSSIYLFIYLFTAMGLHPVAVVLS